MNKKSRFVDTEQWRSSRHFNEMKGWAQLLHLYLYLDRADFAGIAHLQLKPATHYLNTEAFDPEEISGLPEAVRSQLMPNDMGIIAKELEHFWVYHDPGIFINKNFLEKTQGKLLRLSNPPHGRIIKDMAYWHADGFEDVFVEVMKANRGVRFRPLQLCMQDVKSSVIAAQNQNDKKAESARNGAEGRKRNFEDVLMYLDSICPLHLMPEFKTEGIDEDLIALGLKNIKVTKTPALDNKQQSEEEGDPLRPDRHPDQSKPILSNITQKNHDLKLSLGYYMKKDGDYAEPVNPFPNE